MAESYSDDVDDYARHIIEEIGLDEDDWHDAVHETVDGSNWIIYNNRNEEVLNSSKNEPDDSDVAELLGTEQCGDWRKVRQIAAFIAMERDLREALDDIKDEYFACEECSAVTHEDDKHEHSTGELCPKCHAKLFKCDIGLESIDNPTVAVVLIGYEVNSEPDSFKLTGGAAKLALGAMDGTTPIGILLDRAGDYPNEFDMTPEMLAKVVNYLRAKYPNGMEPWTPETFLEDDDNEPVRKDLFDLRDTHEVFEDYTGSDNPATVPENEQYEN